MECLEKSRQIYNEAVEKYKPKAVAVMVSGGSDSATVYHVTKELGLHIDYIIHINTRTGIRETTDFVRRVYGNQDAQYLEGDAGDAYEKYVMRKGFFGRGMTAHTYAYHLLKAGPLRKLISKHIRKRKRGVNVLLLNGARIQESENRKNNFTEIYNKDPAANGNIWVNLIHYWSIEERDGFLSERNIEINPVSKAMCRSGECMCGTMQSQADRVEASCLYPEWGAWLDSLEKKVMSKFAWRWGDNIPSWFTAMKQGQADLFQPMCTDCTQNNEDLT